MPSQINSTVLITGVNGFIGRALAKTLGRNGYRIIGLDVEADPGQEGVYKSIACDLTDDFAVEQAVSQIGRIVDGPLYVIHLAAYYDFSGAESELYEQLTIEGTRRLLRQLQGMHVEQFIFTSTILVMDQASNQNDASRITESSPTRAEWRYPESKLQAESVIQNERGNIPAVILRIAGVYNDMCHSIPIAHQISRIFERQFESHFFPSDQSNGQPFIHIEDLVGCIQKAIQHHSRLNPFEIFLIGEEDIVSYGELQDCIGCHLHGREWTTIRVPKPAAKLGAWIKDKVTKDQEFIQPWMVDIADANYPISTVKARRLLDWQPRHKLRDKISIMLDHLRRNPIEWYKNNSLDVEDIPAGATKEVSDESHLPERRSVANQNFRS